MSFVFPFLGDLEGLNQSLPEDLMSSDPNSHMMLINVNTLELFKGTVYLEVDGDWGCQVKRLPKKKKKKEPHKMHHIKV